MNERLDSEQGWEITGIINNIPATIGDGEGGIEIVLPYNGSTATSVIALVFMNAFGQGGRDNRDLRRKLSGPLINNQPGSRQQREETQGFEHHQRGYRGTGRNHSGRERSIDRSLL